MKTFDIIIIGGGAGAFVFFIVAAWFYFRKKQKVVCDCGDISGNLDNKKTAVQVVIYSAFFYFR